MKDDQTIFVNARVASMLPKLSQIRKILDFKNQPQNLLYFYNNTGSKLKRLSLKCKVPCFRHWEKSDQIWEGSSCVKKLRNGHETHLSTFKHAPSHYSGLQPTIA